MSTVAREPVGVNWLELLFALLSGVVFGLGLAISGMANPQKVLGFLDVAGDWDPTLAIVMLGALAVTAPAFRVILRRHGPWLTPRFVLPTLQHVDARLMAGSALFGIGWGLAGLCPGPAVLDLVTGDTRIMIFVAAMLAGASLANLFNRAGPQEPSSAASR